MFFHLILVVCSQMGEDFECKFSDHSCWSHASNQIDSSTFQRYKMESRRSKAERRVNQTLLHRFRSNDKHLRRDSGFYCLELTKYASCNIIEMICCEITNF